jgi:CDP-paratose 2-epimerase
MRAVVTGGAGFVGCHLADALISRGHDVVVIDNYFRPGVQHNVEWLRSRHGQRFKLVQADIRDYQAIAEAMRAAEAVYHIAGQTAVTTSVTNPRQDFEINALGTFNVLEAARLVGRNPILIFTSTNKVYGGMEDVAITEEATRYRYADRSGIDESQPLDFHSPYGCSKGAADQYVRDYARIYGLRSVVFRMGAIYGPHQFGTEDQAWVAHFAISAIMQRPFTIYGDGKQVRDVLYIDDLTQAFLLATDSIDTTAGRIYNIGGADFNVSIWIEFQPLISRLLGREVEPAGFADWRPGDQLVYISDCGRAQREFGWSPTTRLEDGLATLLAWASDSKPLFRRNGIL